MNDFELAYLECALWSSTDESRDDGGDPLDDNYTIEDFAPDALAKMLEDCRRFQDENREDLESGVRPKGRWCAEELAGHDFWLTRNGHGSGFWDGDWPKEMGERLTASSKRFGSCWLFVGDDGKIHC